MSWNQPKSAYVHIPFCRRRCFYCDFPVKVMGDRLNSDTSGTVTTYLEFLSQEIINTPSHQQPLETIFFGGGTPSLLSVNQIAHILDLINRHFGISQTAEISLEMDPGTFDLNKIKQLQKLGINRFSIGVQAWQDELLKISGRSHSVNDIEQAIDFIQQADVKNFSIDLISGLPNQTLNQWEYSLLKTLKIAPQHISSYDLIIEPITPFSRMYQPGQNPLPSDQLTATMYRLTQEILTTSGYHHYEISNYAKTDYQCRHNLVYWKRSNYYGFGMGAASYLLGRRFTRPRITIEYYDWVKTGLSEIYPNNLDSKNNMNASEDLDLLLETLMLGLRLAEGLSLDRLATEFNQSIVEEILTCLQPYQTQGWVEVVSRTTKDSCAQGQGPIVNNSVDRYLRLTDPEGFLFSNTILASLFHHFS